MLLCPSGINLWKITSSYTQNLRGGEALLQMPLTNILRVPPLKAMYRTHVVRSHDYIIVFDYRILCPPPSVSTDANIGEPDLAQMPSASVMTAFVPPARYAIRQQRSSAPRYHTRKVKNCPGNMQWYSVELDRIVVSSEKAKIAMLVRVRSCKTMYMKSSRTSHLG